MRHVNLTAYEGVEMLWRFDVDGLARYRRQRLAECDKQVRFIRALAGDGMRALRVCEIGSGSGRLLLRLAREAMLELGVGFEVSESRVAFARAFADALSIDAVTFRQEDFLEADIRGLYDVVIGIDVVVNLVAAISPGHLDRIIAKCAALLAPGGVVILEATTCSRDLAMLDIGAGVSRTWKHFNDTDPFAFGLDEVTSDGECLIWAKRFVPRHGGPVSSFTHSLKPLPRDVVASAAERNGLLCTFHAHWVAGDDTDPDEYVVVMHPSSAAPLRGGADG